MRVKDVKIDKNNLVLPELRYGAAGMEDEVLQLPQGSAQLVAFDYGCSRGCPGTLLTA